MQARAAVTMATASSASTSPPRIKVKKELCADNETIKELAETAMNDILGWYGYDSVDRLEMREGTGAAGSSATAIEHADSVARLKPDTDNNSPPSTSSSSTGVLLKTKRSEAKSAAQTVPRQHVVQLQSRGIGDHFLAQDDPEHQPVPSTSSTTERRAGRDAPSSTAVGQSGSPPNDAIATRNGGIVLHHQAHPQHHQHHLNLQGGPGSGGAGAGCDSSTSEKDSSRESSKSPMLMKMLDKQEQTCQWCRKVIPSHQPGILGTTEGMIFCTEACFSQSRRASFKRAKTCDWCRHVRHAVSYVDFQDGASQLQFCSDKCLNQYKMQIFCNETQAHLEMNPHLKEKSTSAGSLITPELWLKNCKSCSMSPVSDRSESVSPVPSVVLRSSPEPSPGIVLHSPTPAKKPLISVAPPSKLLSKSLQSALSRSSPKSSRKRRSASHRLPPQTGAQTAGASSSKRASSTQQQAEYLMTSGPSNNTGSNLNNNNVTIPNNNLSGNTSTPIQPKPCTVISSNVQDLRMLQKKHVSPGGFEGRESIVGGSLAPPPPPPPQPTMNIPAHFLPPPLNMLRPPFFHMNPTHLRFNAQNLSQPQPPPPSAQMGPPPSPLPGVPLGPTNRPPLPGFPGLGAPPPPVTILVPYPIIVPLPLPIPIPIPVIDFLRAALPKEPNEARSERPVDSPKAEAGKGDEEMAMTVNGDESMQDDVRAQVHSDLDAPLDFTVPSVGKLHGGETTFERPVARGTLERPRELPCAKAIDFPRPSGEGMGYTRATIISPCQEEDEIAANGKRESAKQILPKIKISLQETRIIGGAGGEVIHEEEGTATRRSLDNDEEDLERERERKEMAERSRPLRKRKRLVVQQHLEPEPASDGLVDDPENGSIGALGTDQSK
uniref:Sine oculis-binding protein homolog n=1 Tax=Anopheles atroparvus TaxID=41427 RepID=A0AAG5DJ23_ANOAO